MSAIGPGDWVECVAGDVWSKSFAKRARHEGRRIHCGEIYQVREVISGRYADGSRGEGLRFVGIRAWNAAGIEGGWPVEGFRPVYRPKSSLIETLKQPAPEILRELLTV